MIQRAERTALIRHIQKHTSQSKIRRLASQVSQQGRSLWTHLRTTRRASTKGETASRAH
jgi:hypothetical protein